MAVLTLTPEVYLEKVLGGWQGKSIGLTLGSPLRGLTTPARLSFYNPVPGQPTASIALDIPLVWLKLLEEVGTHFAPEEMAVAWLENLDYAQEEMGYAIMNLLRGLPPPASGAHSNGFHHGSLGMMRADFWALVAPGAPQVAASYAYHDATIDHSEEGEWAAMFLAGLMSASFFLTDTFTLLTIGLAMIPRTCRTARAVKVALQAGQQGASWFQARESILQEVGNKNFSDAPQNIGFITMGLLYGGGDFATTLCAGVNCGYDTEAIGSALGAIMGIRAGSSKIPADWLKPVGDLLIPGKGLLNVEPPLSLKAVAERTVKVGQQVIAAHCPDIGIEEAPSEPVASPILDPIPAPTPEPVPAPPVETNALPAPEASAEPSLETKNPDTEETELATVEATFGEQSEAETVPAVSVSSLNPQPADPATAPTPLTQPILEPASEPEPVVPAPLDPLMAIAWTDNTLVKPLLVTNPNAQINEINHFHIMMNAGDTPTITYHQPKLISFSVRNANPQDFVGKIALLAPQGWQITPPPGLGQRQYISGNNGTFYGEFGLFIPDGTGRIEIANALTLRFTPESGNAFDAEFVLLGAACWWTAGPFANFDGEGYDQMYLPETHPGLGEQYVGRNQLPIVWERHAYPNAILDLEPLFKSSSGVCYGQTILRSPTSAKVRFVANTNSGVKVWLNGQLAFRRHHREVFRPLIGSGSWAFDVNLQQGDNIVLVKWVRSNEPYAFSLTVGDSQGRGLPEIGNTSW